MTHDYITFELQARQPLIHDVYRQEQEIIRAKQEEEEAAGQPEAEKAARQRRKDAERVAKQKRKALLHATRSPAACYHLLAITKTPDPKIDSEVELRTAWQEMERNVKCLQGQEREYGRSIKQVHIYYKEVFESPKINLTLLPAHSFVIQFAFMLAQPYISHDEQDFYIVDNPIRKDKVFGLPYIASTSWKGSLRAALWQQGKKAEIDTIRHLFGNEKETEKQERFRAGRLYFFPTFFNMKDLEIINPQDRLRRIGTLPIIFETVPENTEGIFTLLYVPFDLVGEDEETIHAQVAEELQLVAQGIQGMFRISGFGAKTSSGFGLARETISPEGTLRLQASTSATQKQEKVVSSQPAPPALPRYLEAPGRLRPEYRTPESTFRERSEAELKKMSKSDRQMYDKARSWWEREGKHLAGQPEASAPAEPELVAQTLSVAILEGSFKSFQKFVERTKEIAELLKSPSAEVKHE